MKGGDGRQRIEPALGDRLFSDSPDGQSAEGGKYIPVFPRETKLKILNETISSLKIHNLLLIKHSRTYNYVFTCLTLLHMHATNRRA